MLPFNTSNLFAKYLDVRVDVYLRITSCGSRAYVLLGMRIANSRALASLEHSTPQINLSLTAPRRQSLRVSVFRLEDSTYVPDHELRRSWQLSTSRRPRYRKNHKLRTLCPPFRIHPVAQETTLTAQVPTHRKPHLHHHRLRTTAQPPSVTATAHRTVVHAMRMRPLHPAFCNPRNLHLNAGARSSTGTF